MPPNLKSEICLSSEKHFKIRQLNKDNRGIILEANQIMPGYRSRDALYFDETSPLHTMHKGVAEIILSCLVELPKLVLDIGCGAGSLSYFLRQLKPDIRVVTLDGNPGTVDSPFIVKGDHFVVRTDEEYALVDENGVLIQFDLICSFEHWEHILPSTFPTFINNMKKHSHSKTLFWSTASRLEYPPGDEHHVHCNVKSYVKWTEELLKYDFAIAEFSLFEVGDEFLSEEWFGDDGGRLWESWEFVMKNNAAFDESLRRGPRFCAPL